MSVQEAIPAAWLSWRQACEYSGLSEPTLRRLVAEGHIKAYRPVGKKVMLAKVSIEEYFLSRQVVPQGAECA